MVRGHSKDGIRECTLKDGTKTYEARVKRTGEAQISQRFPSRREALAWKRAVDSQIDRGTPPLNSKTVLVQTIIEDYLRHRQSSSNPLPANQITEYERVKLDLGTRAIGGLRRSDLHDWMHLLRTESRGQYKNGQEKPSYAAASVRKFYYSFKVAVDWHSAEHRYHVDEFLFKLPRGTVPPAWAGRRERRLTQSEEDALYAAGINRKSTYSREDWQSIIGFALETALREQEIVFARWKDLKQNGYKLFIPVEHTKTRTSRTVLLSRKARAIVDSQRKNCPKDEARIFFQVPTPDALGKAFCSLAKRAKVARLTFHDLRHEATSRLCEGGQLNQMQVMEMTGHTSMATFKGYLHLLSHENSVLLD